MSDVNYSPMVETYRLTVEHYVVTNKGERIKVEDTKRYEYSFCQGSKSEVFGVRNHAIHEIMRRAEYDLINNSEKE